MGIIVLKISGIPNSTFRILIFKECDFQILLLRDFISWTSGISTFRILIFKECDFQILLLRDFISWTSGISTFRIMPFRDKISTVFLLGEKWIQAFQVFSFMSAKLCH
jgi:hypothetical protein